MLPPPVDPTVTEGCLRDDHDFPDSIDHRLPAPPMAMAIRPPGRIHDVVAFVTRDRGLTFPAAHAWSQPLHPDHVQGLDVSTFSEAVVQRPDVRGRGDVHVFERCVGVFEADAEVVPFRGRRLHLLPDRRRLWAAGAPGRFIPCPPFIRTYLISPMLRVDRVSVGGFPLHLEHIKGCLFTFTPF